MGDSLMWNFSGAMIMSSTRALFTFTAIMLAAVPALAVCDSTCIPIHIEQRPPGWQPPVWAPTIAPPAAGPHPVCDSTCVQPHIERPAQISDTPVYFIPAQPASNPIVDPGVAQGEDTDGNFDGVVVQNQDTSNADGTSNGSSASADGGGNAGTSSGGGSAGDSDGG
jgi:hypothetical protein